MHEFHERLQDFLEAQYNFLKVIHESAFGDTFQPTSKTLKICYAFKRSDRRIVNCVVVIMECTTLPIQMFRYSVENIVRYYKHFIITIYKQVFPSVASI